MRILAIVLALLLATGCGVGQVECQEPLRAFDCSYDLHLNTGAVREGLRGRFTLCRAPDQVLRSEAAALCDAAASDGRCDVTACEQAP